MADWFNAMGVEGAHLYAGIAGGLVRTLLRPGKSIWETVSTGAVGALCAMYATPLLNLWLNIDPLDPSTSNAVAFGVGLVGMSLAEGIISMAQAWSQSPKLPEDNSLASVVNSITPDPKPEDDQTSQK